MARTPGQCAPKRPPSFRKRVPEPILAGNDRSPFPLSGLSPILTAHLVRPRVECRSLIDLPRDHTSCAGQPGAKIPDADAMSGFGLEVCAICVGCMMWLAIFPTVGTEIPYSTERDYPGQAANACAILNRRGKDSSRSEGLGRPNGRHGPQGSDLWTWSKVIRHSASLPTSPGSLYQPSLAAERLPADLPISRYFVGRDPTAKSDFPLPILRMPPISNRGVR